MQTSKVLIVLGTGTLVMGLIMIKLLPPLGLCLAPAGALFLLIGLANRPKH